MAGRRRRSRLIWPARSFTRARATRLGSGQERDGIPPIRSDDLFYGAASFDPQPDWVNLNKVAIPQADEQQRLLANMITYHEFRQEAAAAVLVFPEWV